MSDFSFEVVESDAFGTVMVGYVRRDINDDNDHTYTCVSLWVVPGTL